MSFLAPTAFAFAAAVPVVIVFYLLKRKRVVKLVSSTLLWQRFLADTQASKPFQKLRHNWLLLLQILLLLVAVLSLSRPYFGTEQRGRLRVLILDASASMKSTDQSPSRFDHARAEALALVQTLRDDDETVILQAAFTTEVRQSATRDRSALRRALNGCGAIDSPTRLNEAFKLAATLVKDRSEAEIHLFSDGVADDLVEFANQNLPVVYHRVGQDGDNVGITSLDVRANPENAAQRAIFATVGNFATNPAAAEVELVFEGKQIENRLVNLGPTNFQPLVFIAPQEKDGVFTVRLRASDGLAADNEASMVSLMPQPSKVLLVSRGNRFLEKALRSLPYVRLAVISGVPTAPTGFDLVVIDEQVAGTWPRANMLLVRSAPADWFGKMTTIKNPPIVDWKSAHPILRSVNFDNVQIAEALAVKPPNWALPLVESPQTPLIFAGEHEGHRIVWLGFDPLLSNWPLLVSYPIFVANAVEWLNPAADYSHQLLVHGGNPFRFHLPPGNEKAEVTGPAGQSRTIQVELGTQEVVFGDTSAHGIYRLTSGTNRVTFCVNLLDASESRILPRGELPFGKYARVSSSTVKRANLELWRWIAGAVLLLLLFEWWYYHKRTV